MVDARGLVDELNSLKTMTDAAGNVRATVAPEIANQIDAEIANINRARQPEDPLLDRQLDLYPDHHRRQQPQHRRRQDIPMLDRRTYSKLRRLRTPTSKFRSRRCAR